MTDLLAEKTKACLSPETKDDLLHDLHVHQIELEMQNEELRRAFAELDAVRKRYFDLYDLAPVGYLTLNRGGLILEANLTIAALLEMERSALVHQPLSRYIFPEDQEIHYRQFKTLSAFQASAPGSSPSAGAGKTGETQSWEIRLIKKDAAPFWGRIEGRLVHDPSSGAGPEAESERMIRLIVSDHPERPQAFLQKPYTFDQLKTTLTAVLFPTLT